MDRARNPSLTLLRQHLAAVVSAALAAVDARRATERALRSPEHEFTGQERVRLVAAGKAAAGMARAAAEALGPRLTAAVVTAPDGALDLPPPPNALPRGYGGPPKPRAERVLGEDGQGRGRWQFFPASHPLPDAASEAAGRAALALAAGARAAGDWLLVCLSGGASAMLCAPAEGLTLDDKRAVNTHLLRAGLDIGSMNVVRRHLSAIKGGQLAAAAGRSITLAISDVIKPIEDDPQTIGSGPTTGDATTFVDALGVIGRAGLREALPARVVAHLEAGARGAVAGPVPPGDPRLQAAAYWIVGSRRDAMRAAAATARQIGYAARVVDAPLDGEARHAPARIFEAARGLARPACLICSGETTVKVTGSGRGGRNQELAVAALSRLSDLGTASLASIGTDGIDGPTDAAGGMVTAEMWRALGPEAASICASALENNDAYPLLERLDALVRTGPTGTNVGDLQVLLLA